MALDGAGVKVRSGSHRVRARAWCSGDGARICAAVGAIAADMESLWLARRRTRRRFGVVRVLLDARPQSDCARGACSGLARGARAAQRGRPSALGGLGRARRLPRGTSSAGLAGVGRMGDAGHEGAKVCEMASASDRARAWAGTSSASASRVARGSRCIVELEPLFQCNLACAGCGKIQHPEHVLRRRMPVEQAVAAIEESGAPMVSIAGGEPLIHPEIDEIAGELVRRKRFVYLCTNAILLEKQARQHSPEPVLRVGDPHRRPARAPRRIGRTRGRVRQGRVARSGRRRRRGFRVTTNTTFFTHDSPKTIREVLDFLNDELEVDEMMISPAYAYEKAPDQEHFLGVRQTRELFSEAFADGQAQALAAEPQRRCSSTSSKARSTSTAPRGGSRATRCSAGSVRAT